MKDARGKHNLPTYRIDLWAGEHIAETLAYIGNLEVATTAYWFYAKRYKGEEVTLRQGATVIRTTKPK